MRSRFLQVTIANLSFLEARMLVIVLRRVMLFQPRLVVIIAYQLFGGGIFLA